MPTPTIPHIGEDGDKTNIQIVEGPRPCFAHKVTHLVVFPTDLLMREGSYASLPLNSRSILGSGTCQVGWEDPRLTI